MPKRRSQRRQAEPRSVAPHVRERQRIVAEREASRLARPESRPVALLGHADRKKSAVASTPSGYVAVSVTKPTEWCGPFSVARRMIAEREEAKRQREREQEEDNGMHHPLDEAMKELDEIKQRKAHPSLLWKGSISEEDGNNGSSVYAKRQRRAKVLTSGRKVPSLFDLCVNFVVDNFDHVESLGPSVDSDVRKAVANQLIASEKLSDLNFPVLAEPGIETLEIVDCSSISDVTLTAQLSKLLPEGLRYLALDQAGRCFGARAAAVVADKTQGDLFALSIGGAYLLKDADSANMISKTCPTSVEFKACPLVGPALCESISKSFGTDKPLLELSLEDLVSVQAENLLSLVKEPGVLSQLRTLSLRSIESLNDDIVDHIFSATAATLEGLDLSHNYSLTDAILSSLRLHGMTRLQSVAFSGLKLLTAAGLEALFTKVEGAPPPPSFTSIDLNNCDHQAVTDHVIELMGDQLVQLDMQGSTVVTDTAMEHLAKSSAYSLEGLNVSYCSAITDQGLGYLVDACGSQLSKIQVWGNAQLSDVFLDGHKRANDPSLEIVGAWMKKSTVPTAN